MTTYTAVFQYIYIRNTRSRHTDTDFANIAVQVDNQLYMAPTKSLGDLNNGPHEVDLRINNIIVPDNAQIVKVGISVVNAGNVNTGPLGDIVAGLVSTGADVLVPGSGEFIALVCKVLNLGNLVNPNCDGPVVAASANVNATQLIQAPVGQQIYVLDGDDLGYESGTGCGSNSNYHYAAYLRRVG